MMVRYTIVSISFLGFVGCATIDSAEVRPRAGVPEAARVDLLQIPYDASLPKYALVVETFVSEGPVDETKIRTHHEYTGDHKTQDSTRGTTTTNKHHHTHHHDGAIDITQRSWELSRRDVNIAAQFTSSLAGVGNFVVLSPAAVKSTGSGVYQASIPSGTVGPFVIKATLTEEVREVSGGRSRIFVPGVVSSKSSELQGVVVMDITVLDGRTGALVTAFPAEGTFISQDKRFSAGIVLPLAEQHAFARSVASQAQRVALNSAAEKILAAFRNYRT